MSLRGGCAHRTRASYDGIGAGYIAYALLKAMSGKAREASVPRWVAAAAFVIYFADPWIRQFLR